MTNTVTAPYGCSALFAAWLRQGRPGDLHAALVTQLRPFCGAWLVGNDHAFRLLRTPGGREMVEWEKRSATLATERTEQS